MKSLLEFFSGRRAEPTSLPSLSDIPNLQGKKVLLRAALNVSIQNGKAADDFRIERALPTIKHLQGHNAKVILIAHIGRQPEESLLPVYDILREEVGAKWGGGVATAAEAISDLQDGEVLLLENLRQDQREKANDDAFSQELAALAELYVNDAFADSHREHSSIVGVPRYLDSYFGINFIREYEALQDALTPRSPSIFILGGAKFDTKLPLVEKLADKYDQVFIGGALANDIFKAKGYEVGRSLVSDIDLSGNPILEREDIILPTDVVVEGSGRSDASATDVRKDEVILDAGSESIKQLGEQMIAANTILWNGPLGNYEKGYGSGTEELAKLIAASGAKSTVGGGDTITAIHKLGLNEQFTFLSTAGGAMLAFLEKGTLPAITAVQNKS